VIGTLFMNHVRRAYRFTAIRADLLRRLGRSSEAVNAYDAAIDR
jgi:predicted RNA polymerase sigma factor